jgi:hypothetical protein
VGAGANQYQIGYVCGWRVGSGGAWLVFDERDCGGDAGDAAVWLGLARHLRRIRHGFALFFAR